MPAKAHPVDDRAMLEVADHLRTIYASVRRLEELFPGRSFTPDGHMVGSIGEAWARWMFDIELAGASAEKHDGTAPDGRLVQINATQGRSVAMYSEPDHLIVLAIDGEGLPSSVYNGPGAQAWAAAGRMQKNGQRPVGLAKLAKLDEAVPPAGRLRVVRSAADLRLRLRG